MLLQYIHIIVLPHVAINFVKCTSPSSSKAPLQHDADTPVLHGWDGALHLASRPLFPPNITMVIIAKQLYFCLIRPEDTSQKVRSLSPCAVASRSLAFLWRVWCSGFFLAEWPFRLCHYRTRCTVDIETFVPVSPASSQGPLLLFLGLTCTFRTKVLLSLGDASPS